MSSAVGGLIALGILFMDGTSGLSGWRWLYIIEGVITIAWAGATVFLVPKHYSTAYFLNPEDKAVMRIREEQMEAYSGGSGHYTMQDVKLAAKDITTWVHAPTQVAMVGTLIDAFEERQLTVDAGDYTLRFRNLFANYTKVRLRVLNAGVSIPGRPCSALGRLRLLHRRHAGRQTQRPFLVCHHLRADRYSWIRHSAQLQSSVSRGSILRDIPHLHRLLPLHRDQHIVAGDESSS